eukprot:3860040-Amphidinium_carterae.1
MRCSTYLKVPPEQHDTQGVNQRGSLRERAAKSVNIATNVASCCSLAVLSVFEKGLRVLADGPYRGSVWWLSGGHG